ncbi:MAG TPA: amidohydrolase family protein [Candidatus Avipropionibacterium avicola]|uniref:Amidohydrolase family protein n=1 Tax=Candidatus Avipropionibacterium avicola TaxID=2840701 RepID=A0A9D1GWU5_9ACTN|nr:amidohydrolase family protein [Candidatus Avipropionibacterium avicola]
MRIIDTAAFVGSWPFRPLPDSGPEALKARLQRAGIAHALVSPVETVLQRSPQTANRVWAARLADDPFFSFVPVADPAQAGAVQVLDQAEAPAVRLLPGPHGYGLDQARDLATEAGRRDVAVILQWRMIDVRMAHPDVVHRELTAPEVRSLAEACPDTRFLVAGARQPEVAAVLADGPANLWCELSTVESPNVVRRLIEAYGIDRLLCGTHAPIHVPEALAAKLAAADLSEGEQEVLGHRTAEELFRLA